MFEDFGTTFVFAFMFAAIILVFRAIKFVPQGYGWTVERFGQYMRTLKPGLGLINPLFERVGRKISMMEMVLDIPSQEVITKDNAQVTVDAIAFIQVVDVARAAYEVQDLNRAIANLALTNVRTVIGSMDLDEVLSPRAAINARRCSGPWRPGSHTEVAGSSNKRGTGIRLVPSAAVVTRPPSE